MLSFPNRNERMTMVKHFCSILLAALFLLAQSLSHAAPGYFRQPAIHGDTVVFVAEGDIWRANVANPSTTAQRLTTHPAAESNPAISPDGTQVAFTARYEGPAEIYVMPLAGGTPTRLT